MSDPVMMSKSDLDKMAKDMAAAVEVNARLRRDLEAAQNERRQALDVANRASGEVERLRKAMPADKVQEELKALRAAMGEAHKRISGLEKELAAAQAEAEARRKEVAQVQRRFEGVQATFDTFQIARDKAQAERDQALADVQKGLASYQKLQAELDAFKKAAAETKQPQRAAKTAEPVKA
jgi:chromosome segregation ATPase